MKKKRKEVSESLLKTIAIIILLVIAVSLSIIFTGVIKLNHINHNSIKEFYLNRNIFKEDNKKDEYIEIDTSNIEDLINITIDDNSKRLYDICVDGCNLKVNSGGIAFYYLIDINENDKYILSIVKDNRSIIYKKDIGKTLANLQLLYYAGYLTLYNTYVDDFFIYDYSVVVDSNNKYDEYISLDSSEMEFSSKGIVYYYDLCEDNKSYKIKAVRKPFDEKSYILDKTETNYTWC